MIHGGEWDDRGTVWLPDSCTQSVLEHENARFRTLVGAVSAYATRCSAEEGVNATLLQQSIPWISHIHKFLKTKTKYDVEEVGRLYDVVLQLVHATASTVPITCKWLQVASLILRSYRSDLRGVKTLDMEPYWLLFTNAMDQAQELSLEGALASSHRPLIADLCKLARGLFPASAAPVVWERLISKLRLQNSPESLSAAVQLLIFFPHHGVATNRSLPWNEWAQLAIELWRPMANNIHWNGAWMCFFARLAKHDHFGAIDWPTILPHVCSRAPWIFNVRVGNAAAPHLNNIPPQYPIDQVAYMAIKRGTSVISQLAKILMCTLRTSPQPSAPPTTLTALEGLQQIVTLFEHFFHATNIGQWSDQFSDFVDSSAWYLMRRRLQWEASAAWQGDPAHKLDPSKLQPVISLLLQLALPALHHKSGSLRAASLELLSNAMYVEPDIVLPVVVQRFHEALEASDSVHQLSGSIRLLCFAVRPLLLRGLVLSDPDAIRKLGADSMNPHELACQEIAGAMMQLLPGLDANDQPKTERTICFYLTVFSNCVAFTGLDLPREGDEAVIEFPMYISDFVTQLLEHLFGVIDALKGHVGGGVDTVDSAGELSGSWFGRYHRTQRMVHELFYKMPPSLLPAVVQQVAEFVLGLSSAQGAMDAGALVMASAEMLPDTAIELIMNPAIKLLQEDADTLKGDINPSDSAAGRVHAHLMVLTHVLYGLKQLSPARSQEIYDLMLEVSQISKPVVISAASAALYRLFSMHCDHALDSTPRKEGPDKDGKMQSMGIPESLNNAVARWVSKDCRNCPKLTWSCPSEGEVDFALKMMKALIAHVREELVAMKEQGQLADAHISSRMRLRRLQVFLGAIALALNPIDQRFAIAEKGAVPEAESIDICWEPPNKKLVECSLMDDVLQLSLEVLEGTDAGNTFSIAFAILELERISGSVVASIASSGATIKARDRSMNEPMYADRLLGLEIGTFGPGGRQPYWACRRIVSQAYSRRVSLRASYHAQSASHPEIQLQDLTPVAQKCLSTLVQLCFHRYASTSRRAARSCASFVQVFTGLPASLLTAAASSMALMDASDPGFVPEELTSTAGFSIPPSIEQATAVLSEQTTRLADIVAAGGDHSDAEDRCTSDNKHRVTGAVTLLEVCQSTVPVVAALVPAAFTTIYLSMVVIQGYSQVDVKMHVNKLLASFGVLFSKPQYIAAASTQQPQIRAVTELFMSKVAANSLHWRSTVLAYAWFSFLTPVTDDLQLAKQIVTLQLEHGVRADMLLVKDIAMSGLILTLSACLEGRAPADLSEVVFECVRTAAADADWRSKLVSTINDLHTCADGVGPLAVRTIPETAVLALLRRGPAMVRRPLGRLHLCTEPHGPSKDPGSQQKATHRPHMRLAYLLACLMCIAPAEILSACKAPATEYNQLSPEKQALEPSMEYTVMEIIHAGLVSGAAFSKGSDGQSAWDSWLWTVLQGRYESSTVDRAGVIVNTIAHAHRLIANQATGAQTLAPNLTDADAAQMLEVCTSAMCQLLDKWSGSSASDRKHALLLAYSLDMLMQICIDPAASAFVRRQVNSLMQLQGEKPTEILAKTILALLDRGRKLLAESVNHPLQPVRTVTAQLWPILMTAVSNFVALDLQPAQDSSVKDSLRQQLFATVQQIYANADDAVTAACSAGEDVDEEMEQNDSNGVAVVQGNEALQWDSRIGSATAVTSQLAASRLLMPGLHQLTLVALPWAIKAQTLQNAQLQGLTTTIRGLIVQLKNFMFEAKDVPVVLDAGLKALESSAWQARGSALSLLQVLWFRNFFTLTSAHLEQLLAAFESSLQDDKLEIRTLASNTLSGVIKVLPPDLFDTVKSRIVKEAQAAFPGRKQQPTIAPSVVQLHSCVLKLAALLQSSPYELAEWMDPVLLLLAKAARCPPPARTSATQALGEFRKTQESTASTPLKERLESDVWDSIRDAGENSYFA